MKRHLALAAVLFATLSVVGSAAEIVNTVRIAVPKSMFRDVPVAVFKALAVPFGQVVLEQTGMRGELSLMDSPEDVRQKLTAGDFQLGVFHGFEFAWAKAKHPTLEPLMLVSVDPAVLESVAVVKKESSLNAFRDLKGKKIGFSQSCREHTRLFMSRQCHLLGQCAPDEYFSKIQPSGGVEDSLDELVDRKIDAVFVEKSGLQWYQRQKPACCSGLRVLESSELFPASVIAYNRGATEEAVLRRFRDGMASAHRSEGGRRLMSYMRINGFETVPANYDQKLADVIKSYPPL